MSPAGSFWSFSLEVYGAPRVEAACLDLQDRFGADVNLALYCLWIGRSLTQEALVEAVLTAEPLHGFIKPLREMRRSMRKGVQDGAREALRQAELKAEKLEQDALEALGPPGRPNAEAAAANLLLYAQTLGMDADAFMGAAAPLIAALD